jgi:serine acetyltransferase
MNAAHIRIGLALFRAAQRLRGGGGRGRRLIAAPIVALYRGYSLLSLGIDIPTSTVIGSGLVIHHGVGLVVHARARIGDDVTLRQGVTIGTRRSGEQPPRIGDRVDVGSGAQILGDIEIGDDAVIGAGAIVLSDVPAGRIAVGNPARLLPAT